MSEIEVKITIPESEYKTWFEYQEEGIAGVKFSLKSDISQRLRQDSIKDFEIEVNYHE